MTNQYIELHARSVYSFLEGASQPEELIAAAFERDIPAIALTDRNGVYGAPKFYMAGRKNKLRAHVGAEIALTDGSYLPVLVKTRAGYQNLCRLVTLIKLRAPKGEGAATYDELARFSSGLICLTGDGDGPLARDLSKGKEKAVRLLERLSDVFGCENVYIEVQRHFLRDEETRNQALVEIARKLKFPIVATNGVCYARPERRELLDVFTCIKNHERIATAGRLLARNAERFLKSGREMVRLFADLPEAIATTGEISSRLEFSLENLGYEFPRYSVPEGETEDSFLRKRAVEGARVRYTGKNGSPTYERAITQIAHELLIIEKLGLAGYFLIVWDLVNFCRYNGILVQGRGSAANSAVCYSLGLTAVDPVGMELLFERFLSEERGEWPDIDLDLPSGDRRESVIRYVYQKYGEHGAAMTANVITYRGRSAVREIGKVMGFDEPVLDRISKLTSRWEWQDPKETADRNFEQVGLDVRHPRIQKFLQLCSSAQDVPRHLGQHSGGMVICQGALDTIVPLEPASMPGRVVVQWDKDDCADMGIVKVDLLGLGMMAALQDSLTLIRDNYDEEVDLAHLPQNDPKVYAALQKADTVGLFQVESRAQMSCLPRLKPVKFYDIVVQVALIRPGPIVGNMVHPYIRRREGIEEPTCMHPSLEPVLRRTLGVPLFQEQLLRMSMACAGFTGGEAEELRRALTAKRSEAKMHEVEIKLRHGMEANGITGKPQDDIVHSITSFALYGFPESHAASFALIAYASAFLRCHYLAAFTASLLNNQPMGFYQPATLIKDAQHHGLKFKPIDVTRSDWLCTIEEERGQRKLRMGLMYVKGLRRSSGDAILAERSRRPFTSIEDLRLRVPELNKAEMRKLAQVGALNFIGRVGIGSYHRRSALWNVERAARPAGPLLHGAGVLEMEVADTPIRQFSSLDGKFFSKACMKDRSDPNWIGSDSDPDDKEIDHLDDPKDRENKPSIGDEAPIPNESPTGDEPPTENTSSMASGDSLLRPMTSVERLNADLSGTGFTIGPHPMAYIRERMVEMAVTTVSDLRRLPNNATARVAGAVIVRQRPGTAKGFLFLSLEDETGILNIIVNPDTFDDNKIPLVESNFLVIDGVVQSQGGVVSVKANKVRALDIAVRATTSRNFH